jgi:hypothetical protein
MKKEATEISFVGKPRGFLGQELHRRSWKVFDAIEAFKLTHQHNRCDAEQIAKNAIFRIQIDQIKCVR